ncbi:universal stress protein [Micromonospora sp. NPDC049559]|uniref:universal stress protein n=1 Tax=Micromonospora sp. NPDC049559 TaxID=3155923 RepID=UPI00343587FD
MSTEPLDQQPSGREGYRPDPSASPFERGTDGPKVIMVGVDGSRTSLRAAAYAAGLARRQRSTLVVVYVAAPAAFTSLASGLAATAVQQTQDEIAEDLRQQVRTHAEEVGTRTKFVYRRGDAYTELCAAADELRADLVVVGSSTQAGHRLVGSIATRLVKAGHWPVVVVP